MVNGWTTEAMFRAQTNYFHHRLVVMPAQFHIHCVSRLYLRLLKRSEPETDHSSPYSTTIKNTLGVAYVTRIFIWYADIRPILEVYTLLD
jgi:hypothetical protein